MSEKPILFSTPMVKAILEGRKSQTRRVCPGARELSRAADWPIERAPYRVGDQLWVREKTLCWQGGAGGLSTFVYTDDPEVPELLRDKELLKESVARINKEKGEAVAGNWQWRSGRFMFKWQARLWLEVTEVRVQRLQEITEADCEAEGMGSLDVLNHFLPHYVPGERYVGTNNYVAAFREVWDFLNGKTHPWESNPWVWCYSFKRVSIPDGQEGDRP